MWQSVWNNSWVIGDFIWTAMDYLGESSIGFETQTDGMDECEASEPFPWHISFCGDLDVIGQPKPQAAYRSVLWGKSVLELAVHIPTPAGVDERVGGWGWPEERASWTWPNSSAIATEAGRDDSDCPCWPCPCNTEPPPMRINVYTKECDSVVLYLNGKQLTAPAPVSADSQYTVTFNGIAYAPGNLTAVGTRNGTGVPGAQKTLLTAGAAASLRLSVDRATIFHHRNDLAYVTVTAVDSHGVEVPDAANLVNISLSMPLMEVAAIGNGMNLPLPDPTVRPIHIANPNPY